MRSRDSGLPLDTRNTMGTSGFSKAYLLEKAHPRLSSKIHGIWHLLADWDQVPQEKLWNMEEG